MGNGRLAVAVDELPTILTRAQLRKFLQLGEIALSKIEREGLPRYQVSEGIVRFNLDEVLQWLRENKLRTGEPQT